jgi:hypothetical protein
MRRITISPSKILQLNPERQLIRVYYPKAQHLRTLNQFCSVPATNGYRVEAQGTHLWQVPSVPALISVGLACP